MADVSVRPARAADAAALAGIQAACWLADYQGVLPGRTLAWIASSQPSLAESWRQSAQAAPTRRHRVLAACAGDQVVGGAALAPAPDPDLLPDQDAELVLLMVTPTHRRAGHASRLLAAAVDHLRGEGFGRAVAWVDSAAAAAPALLACAGWAPDGTVRDLDLDGDGTVVVRQHRWHTDLTTDPDRSPHDTDRSTQEEPT